MSSVTVEETKQYVVIGGVDDTLTTVEVKDEVVNVLEIGIQGPEGPAGTSGDKHYETPLSAQTQITVTHNLGKYPAVSVFDSAGDEVEGDYHHIDTNNTRLTFSAAFSGKAIFN